MPSEQQIQGKTLIDIESLASAGQLDAAQLTIYGLAYLTELHEEQDPRLTGC
jgi:hypothetical protein